MPFTPKAWENSPATKLSASALIDLEERVTDYADTVGGEGGATNLTDLEDVSGLPDLYGKNVPAWNGTDFEFVARGPRINVHDYGAKGDGVTSDNTAFVNALAAAGTIAGASGGCTVFCRPGAVYKVTGDSSTPRFEIPQGVTMDLMGSVMDFSSSADFTIGFGSTGTVPSSGAGYEVMSGNVAKGDWEVNCTNASEFADGDWVLLSSEGDEGDGTGKRGEIARVVVPTGSCAAMTNSQTTITLGATGGNLFGNTNSGGGRVQIDSEQIDYTAASVSTISGCTRAVNGTSAATHAAGANVTFVPASNQVLLMHRIVHQHGYQTADTATIRKIAAIKDVGLRHGKILGPGNVGGKAFIAARFIYCISPRVVDVTFDSCNSVNVTFGNVVHGVIDGCSMYKSILANPASANLGYGILLTDATQDCTIANTHILRMRHCISHGNANYGYPRRNVFVGNHFLYASGDNVDTHSPTDDLHFIGNVIMGGSNGIVLRCPRATIVGNHFEYTNGPGIQGHFVHESPVQWKIHDNKIMDSRNNVGILINSDTIDVDGVDFIQITNNAIDCGVQGGIYMGYTTGVMRSGVQITGNVIANCPSGYNAIEVGNLQGAVIANNVINRPHINSKGIVLANSDKASVSGNVVHYESIGTGVGFDFDNCDDTVISANTVANALTGINVQSDSAYARVHANNTRGCTTEVNLNGVTTNVGDPQAQGTVPAVASAATVTLPDRGSVFSLTGTTGVTSITASWAGRVVTLILASSAQLADGSNLKLSAAGPNTADDTITLACDGTNWHEQSRSVN